MKIAAFSKTYGGQKVLDFPGMDLQRGKIYAIIGANGSGKSTFAKILAGVVKPDKKEDSAETFTVGYMPQKAYAFRMTARANILLNGKDKTRAEALMEAVRIRHLEDKRADRLSGGETARMALARLMMKYYDVVVLDEPTAAMDVETILAAEELIRNYVREADCALLLVTHSLHQAKRMADEVLYFHGGKLLEAGPKEHVFGRPERTQTRQFLEFYGIIDGGQQNYE